MFRSATVGRSLAVLGGAAAAGAIVWAATRVDAQAPGGYWVSLAILFGAGLVLAVALLAGRGERPQFRIGVVVLAVAPILVAAGWVMVAGEPHPGWLQDHVGAWSRDLGIGGPVEALGSYAAVLALGVGLVLVLALAPFRPRQDATAAEAAPAEATEESGETEVSRAA